MVQYCLLHRDSSCRKLILVQCRPRNIFFLISVCRDWWKKTIVVMCTCTCIGTYVYMYTYMLYTYACYYIQQMDDRNNTEPLSFSYSGNNTAYMYFQLNLNSSMFDLVVSACTHKLIVPCIHSASAGLP